jgi:hypothetical protein
MLEHDGMLKNLSISAMQHGEPLTGADSGQIGTPCLAGNDRQTQLISANAPGNRAAYSVDVVPTSVVIVVLPAWLWFFCFPSSRRPDQLLAHANFRGIKALPVMARPFLYVLHWDQ